MKIKQILTTWLPRILMILFIILLSLFSLDVFGMEGSLLEKMGGFLMHNISTIFFIIALFYAWKNPKVGGIIIIIVTVIFTIRIGAYQRLDTFILLSLPSLLSGILFLLNKDEHN